MSVSWNPQVRNIVGIGVALGRVTFNHFSIYEPSFSLDRIFRKMSWNQTTRSTLCVSLAGEVVYHIIDIATFNKIKNLFFNICGSSPTGSICIGACMLPAFVTIGPVFSYSLCFLLSEAFGCPSPELPVLSEVLFQLNPLRIPIHIDLQSILYGFRSRASRIYAELILFSLHTLSERLFEISLENNVMKVHLLLLISIIASRCLVGAFKTINQFDTVFNSNYFPLLHIISLAFFVTDLIKGNPNGAGKYILFLSLFIDLVCCLNRETQEIWDHLDLVIPQARVSTEQRGPLCILNKPPVRRIQQGSLSQVPHLPLEKIASYMEPRTLKNFARTHKSIYEIVVPTVFRDTFPQLCSALSGKMSVDEFFSICMRSFGPDDYAMHLGVDVGRVPPLPSDLQDILNAPCPLSRGKQVKDTHMLVLVPERINGSCLTLNQLKMLALSPLREGIPADINACPGASSLSTLCDVDTNASSHWVLISTAPILYSNKTSAEFYQLLAGVRRSSYEVIRSKDAVSSYFLEQVRKGALQFADCLVGVPSSYKMGTEEERTTCLLLSKVKTGIWIQDRAVASAGEDGSERLGLQQGILPIRHL